MLREPENWHAVKALAKELMIQMLRTKIDYQEAIRIISDAQGHYRQLVKEGKYRIDPATLDPKGAYAC